MQRNITKPKEVKFKQRNFRSDNNYHKIRIEKNSVVPTNTVTEITK